MAFKLGPLAFRPPGRLPIRWVTRAEVCWPLVLRPRLFSTSRLEDATPDEAKRSRTGNSSLVINGKLRNFEAEGGPDFSWILTARGQAYFDRTGYLPVLDRIQKPILFFRPRRFGKSLTVSMLEHFHDVHCKDVHQSFYQGLDVQNHITNGTLTPGQFLILKFDFSRVYRGPNMNMAAQSLRDNMTQVFEKFYTKYATHLGGNHFDKINPRDPSISVLNCVELVDSVLTEARRRGEKPLADIRGIYLLVDEYDAFSNSFLAPYHTYWLNSDIEGVFKNFWSMVKSLQRSIRRMFITGISPLSLTDIGSGFNVAANISFDERAAGLCGLARTDIEAALKICCTNEDYQRHLSTMTKYLNGFHFCDQKKAEAIYNTDTCLSCLQSVIDGTEPRAQDPDNSEVSEEFLEKFSSSPCAIRDFEKALRRDERGEFVPFEYDRIKRNFKLADLRQDIEKSQPAWCSLMLYYGGLTFYSEDPAHYLKIPNEVAAKRIAEAVLDKYGLRNSLTAALHSLKSSGNIESVLNCYRDLMAQRDVGYSDYEHSERIHRDSFYYSLLQNASLRPLAEFRLTMPTNKPGRADLVLPLGKYLIITEWKVVQIDFLDIKLSRLSKGVSKTSVRDRRGAKASVLSKYTIEQIQNLKFTKNDKFRSGKNLKQWIEDEASKLKDYITSAEVKGKLKDEGLLLRAHMIVVIESRHILVWDMNDDGELVDTPHLIGS